MKVLTIASAAAAVLLTSCAGSSKPPMWYTEQEKATECAGQYCGTGESESDGTPVGIGAARDEARAYALGRLAVSVENGTRMAFAANQGKLGKGVARNFNSQVTVVTQRKLANVNCKFHTAGDNTVYSLCYVPRSIDMEILKDLQ